MPVKIRLMRIGAKRRPFYRVVAVDERKKRTGQYLELLGTYNPLTQPKEIILKQDRIEHWTKQGAVMSHGFLRILGQAPQKPPRKAKRDKGQGPKEPKVEESNESEEPKVTEETQTTEPAETSENTEPAPIEETVVSESTETPTDAPADVEPTENQEESKESEEANGEAPLTPAEGDDSSDSSDSKEESKE